MYSPETGKFAIFDIRLGSRGDSYYEYLLKQWIQTVCNSYVTCRGRIEDLTDHDYRTGQNPYIAR